MVVKFSVVVVCLLVATTILAVKVKAEEVTSTEEFTWSINQRDFSTAGSVFTGRFQKTADGMMRILIPRLAVQVISDRATVDFPVSLLINIQGNATGFNLTYSGMVPLQMRVNRVWQAVPAYVAFIGPTGSLLRIDNPNGKYQGWIKGTTITTSLPTMETSPVRNGTFEFMMTV